MLTYNNLEKFERCISSMAKFFYQESVLEIIILDNGSTGEIIHYLGNIEKNIPKVKVIFSGKNLGVAGGRKILFEKAKGNIIISVDSDVIFIQHYFMLDLLNDQLKPLPWEGGDQDTIYIVGGGGGKHPFFPSICVNDVINLRAPKKMNTLALVDDIAGWCQCFRRSLLEKVHMDTDFSPFYGEDTDFCIQTINLGGKLAIMGEGIIAHSFSSCRNIENIDLQNTQWEKVLKKWYPWKDYFPDDSLDWYAQKYETSTPLQDYLSNDILYGRITKTLMEKLDYHQDNIWEIDSYVNLDQLISIYLSVKSSFLKEDHRLYVCRDINVIHLSTTDPLKGPMENVRTININHKINLDIYTLLLMIVKSTRLVFDEIKINDKIPEINQDLNRKGISRFVRLEKKEIDYPEIFDFDTVKEMVNSYPIKDVLRSSLMAPINYSNTWCPNFSPRHILPELFLRIYSKWDNEYNPLTIIVNDFELTQKTVDRVKKHGDIMYINIGQTLEKIPSGVDYYFQIEKYSLFNLIGNLSDPKLCVIYQYSHLIILDNTKIDLIEQSGIDEFYQKNRFQNYFLVQNDFSFFSFFRSDLEIIKIIHQDINQKKDMIYNGKRLDVETMIKERILKIPSSFIWRTRKIDNIIHFSRLDNSPYKNRPVDYK